MTEETPVEPTPKIWMVSLAIAAGILLFANVALRSGSSGGPADLSAVTPILSVEKFEEITQGSKDRGSLVYFGADWCGPCRVMKPIFGQAAQTSPTDVGYYTVDVDKLGPVVQKLGITGIPLVIAFNRKGAEIHRSNGVVPISVLDRLARDAAK
jgi:thioredoxin 1